MHLSDNGCVSLIFPHICSLTVIFSNSASPSSVHTDIDSFSSDMTNNASSSSDSGVSIDGEEIMCRIGGPIHHPSAKQRKYDHQSLEHKRFT